MASSASASASLSAGGEYEETHGSNSSGGRDDDDISNECLLSVENDDVDNDDFSISSNEDYEAPSNAGTTMSAAILPLATTITTTLMKQNGEDYEDSISSSSFWDTDSVLYKRTVQEIFEKRNVLVEQLESEHDKKSAAGDQDVYVDDDDDRHNSNANTRQSRRRNTHCTTPSAAKAEAVSQELLSKVQARVHRHGTLRQQRVWNEASVDQRHALIAALFLPRELGGGMIKPQP
jgi:Skp family chaperone for outer membrane proteins